MRETRNKNKEDRNVSKFVVSSAMGLNACGIYANDSIFKPYVRSFVPYLFHPIPGRNREEEKLRIIARLKIGGWEDWKVACFLGTRQTQ